MTHSVFWLRSNTSDEYDDGEEGEEPYFALDEPINELGASWEFFVFGGKIQPINLRDVSADCGLMMFEWMTEEEADEVGGKVFYALEMDYIGRFFERRIWGLVQEFGVGVLRLRLDDARCRSWYPLTTDHEDLYESE
ncbi:MAG: hypothetical protein M1812_004493 [Candelaria pacifica]|nr:MAG: hypothetical protein M1812_004493 [Candelaria pacifica]